MKGTFEENVKFVKGDILTANNTEKNVIVCQQVNCKGVMGAGLAKQVKTKFPDLFNRYLLICEQINNKKTGLGPGSVQYYDCGPNYRYIVANLFAQDEYGREPEKVYTDYKSLEKCFVHISNCFPNAIIRIPHKIGCGLGGGDWEVVKEIIKKNLIDKNIDVEIWSLE